MAQLRQRAQAGLIAQNEALEKLQTTSAVSPADSAQEKVDADLTQAIPKITPELNALKLIEQSLRSKTLPDDQRKFLSEDLLKRLQPIGRWLDDAVHLPFEPELTPEQIAEFNRLDKIDREPDWPAKKKDRLSHLRVKGPSFYYTLQFLSVPLVVQTDPGATVFWEAPTGGFFEDNGLTIHQSIANKHGIASVFWASRGSAVGPADIVATSPQYRAPARFEVHVINLVPRPTL